jgi:hypothetical protein
MSRKQMESKEIIRNLQIGKAVKHVVSYEIWGFHSHER